MEYQSEQVTIGCNHMDESHKCNVEPKKPDTKSGYLTYAKFCNR